MEGQPMNDSQNKCDQCDADKKQKQTSENEIEQPQNFQPIIWRAAEDGNIDSVKYLVTKNPEIVNKPDLQTPLHWAARAGRFEVCKFLLEHGANANAKSNEDSTPLHWAAQKGQPRIVELLLKNGADPNSQEIDGETPLHFASYYNNFESVKLLIKAGAIVNKRNEEGLTPLKLTTSDDIMDYLLKIEKKQKIQIE